MKREWLLSQFNEIYNKIKKETPLIHCITNHITINDCANVILFTGGKAIMAEHKEEVYDITSSSCAFAVNLGNISSERMESILISGSCAREKDIPTIIDVVGVGCSNLRKDFALRFITEVKPQIIKGNMSEIRGLLGLPTLTKGIDVKEGEETREDSLYNNIEITKELSKKYNCVVVSTGPMDIITFNDKSYVLENGCKTLGQITGTGCMVNALIANFISSGFILEGAILGVALMGIAGELADSKEGLFSFKGNLLDKISLLTPEEIIEKIRIRVI